MAQCPEKSIKNIMDGVARYLKSDDYSFMKNIPSGQSSAKLPVILSLGHLVTRSLGHPVIWSLGHLVTWSLSHSVTWSLGHYFSIFNVATN